MINDTMQTIMKRYSCRSFNSKMPTDEDLYKIAHAALAAPSGMNRQLWRVIIVKNKELIEDMEKEGMNVLASMPDKSTYNRIMSRGGLLYYNAPCMIMIPITKSEQANAEILDCGIISENVALAATSLGIDNLICGLAGLCFVGAKKEEFEKRLGFPKGFEFGIAVLLGYADKKASPHELDLSKISIIE